MPDGRVLTLAQKNTPKLRKPIPQIALLTGSKLMGVKVRGKYLGLEFSNNMTLISHLGMSGTWNIIKSHRLPDPKYLKHQHVILQFGGIGLRKPDWVSWIYTDPRRFGAMDLVKSDEVSTILGNLGYDALKETTTAQMITVMLDSYGVNWTLKQWLLDQSQLVGIGNIYASEIAFAAKIHPETRANDSTHKAKQILQHTRIILQRAIDAGGSTIKSYQSGYGEQGTAQKYHLVYGRSGLPCKAPGCTGTIQQYHGKDKRTTYFCPVCQPEDD